MAGRPRKIENFFDAPKSKTTFSEGKKSAGILDDYAIRKNIGTKEGTIEHTPTASNHIVNKAYADGNFVLKVGDTMSGNLKFLDNIKALFGTGSDAFIMFDGTDFVYDAANFKHKWKKGTTTILEFSVGVGVASNPDQTEDADFVHSSINDTQAFFIDSSADEVSTGASSTFNIKGVFKGSRQCRSFGFPSTTTGASNRTLEPGHRVNTNTATRGHLMTRPGSVVSIAITVDINQNTDSADLPFVVRLNNSTALVTETVSNPAVADGKQQTNTFTRGDNAFVAGDTLQVRMNVPANMVTDDVIVDLEIVYDT